MRLTPKPTRLFSILGLGQPVIWLTRWATRTFTRLNRVVVSSLAMQGSRAVYAICLLISAFRDCRLVAQSATVQLAITITDPTGAVVPGAEVGLTQQSDMAQPLLYADRNGQVTVSTQ